MNHWPKDRAETFDRDLSLIAWIRSFLEESEQASTIDRRQAPRLVGGDYCPRANDWTWLDHLSRRLFSDLHEISLR
jgi:hypothetical protein